MGTKKILTVVLPVRNRAAIVGRTLESISAQTCLDFKLIIVNNGSTDNTVDVISRWATDNAGRLDVGIIDEPNPGAAKARNKGLAAVDTRFTMFFDSDDVMRPDHMKKILEYLEKRPDTEILRWDVSFIDSDGWIHTKSPRFHDEMQLHLMHGTLSTLRWVATTELLRTVGGWNESLSTMDDFELGTRMIIASTKTVRKLHGEPTVAIYHYDDGNVSGNSYHEKIGPITDALKCVELSLKSADRPADLIMLRHRRAIIASLLKREKQPEEAHAMLSEAIEKCNMKEKLLIRCSYLTNLLLGRGGTAVSLQFAGKKKEKR